MKEYLLLLAKYNRDADSKVLKILEGMTDEDRTVDRKSFFKSLHGLLDHMASVDVVYQGRIRSSYGNLSGLSHKFSDNKIDFGKVNFPEFSELKAALETLDNAFIEAVSALADEDFNKIITFSTPRGDVSIKLGLLLLRYINHGTHHRGQISQILDELKIDNDFSSIAPNYA